MRKTSFNIHRFERHIYFGLFSAFIIFSQSVFSANNTPMETMEKMLKAIKDYDVNLWNECVSDVDKENTKDMSEEYIKKEIQSEKIRKETKFNKILGNNAMEYANATLLNMIREFDVKQPLDLTFIKSVQTWDDRYAEVIIFFPLSAKGIFSPFRLCFVKENGSWNFYYGLSADLFLSSEDVNETVKYYLLINADMQIERAETKYKVKKEFTISNELSEKYFSFWKNASSYLQENILQIWLLTEDEKAFKVLEEQKAKGLTKLDGTIYKQMAENIKNGVYPRDKRAGSQKRTLPGPETEAKKWIMHFGHGSGIVQSCRKLIAKFPEDEYWCVFAQYKIAEDYQRRQDNEKAVKEYNTLFLKYPKAKEAINAKAEAAKLYWEKLGQQDKAIILWAELEADNALPPGTPYKGKNTVVPKTILTNKDTGYLKGITDFIFDEQGSMFVYGSDIISVQGTNERVFSGKLEKYSDEGKYLGTVFNHNLKYYANRVYLTNGRFHLNSGHKYLTVIDAKGQIMGELGENKGQLVFSKEEIPSSGNDESSAEAFWIDTDYFYALHHEKLNQYELEYGRLIRQFNTGPYIGWNDYGSTLIVDTNREAIFNVEGGVVVKVEKDGKLIKMKGPEIAGDTLGQVSDIYCDDNSNIYCADITNKKIAMFDRNGKYLRSYSHSSIVEPMVMAVDKNENIYIVSRGNSPGSAIKVFDKSNNYLWGVGVRLNGIKGVSNASILDMEISGDYLYLVIDKYVLKCDLKGTQVSNFKSDDSPRLVKNNKGEVFFSSGWNIYKYDGDKSEIVFELRAKNDKYSSIKIASFGFLPGDIVLTADGLNLVQSEFAGKELKKVTSGQGVSINYTYNIATDKEGNFWVLTGQGEIKKADKDWKVICSIETASDFDNYERIRRHNNQSAPLKPRKDKLWRPVDVSVDKNNNIYVLDSVNMKLHKYSPDGTYGSAVVYTDYLKGHVKRMKTDNKGRIYFLTEENGTNMLIRLELNKLFP
ncbi:MAG: hypothetical protein A2231_13210 [Candidatus Firestonebacteria bacterium RIFOXYA2_FULL_40_8]|nr:MAG: hypothetical protein A2231_13210 [Candidatus Firestonebacteria bacterium RIFOXYA2_FULL_40_8]